MANDDKTTAKAETTAKAKTTTGNTSAKKRAERDGKGNVIDPPVIPSYERELADASALGNQGLIDEVTERYTKARDDLADRMAAA